MHRSGGNLASLALEAETVALRGDTVQADRLYEALQPHEHARVLYLESRANSGLALAGARVAYFLGLLARTVGRLDSAAHHLEGALAMHAAAGEVGWAARVRCELARVLLAGGDEASRRDALVHLDAVAEWFQGRSGHVHDEVAVLRGPTETGGAGPNVIRREGDFWRIEFAGHACLARESKGLRLLALLLRHPGRQISALALAAEEESGFDAPITVGNHADRAAIERARVRVTRALHGVLGRIADSHAALGEHLAATVRTGRICAYVPDPRMPTRWTS